ncbi:glycosyltransferase 61 family protein [Paracoccus yeei]|uniref:Glycosyltransferase family 61 protein n=2 Tax=Paracoccus TaxID=265 RepID=A0A5P2R056_9RHOB|nr:glycosyltransferase family 61 protein [Paracoccus yeei]MBY0135673.1 glycosyltransferase family 61 protein [Paracoccus yeei]QEU10142.1 glycosyltransferase family 61 protein [Paracoccus yeei]
MALDLARPPMEAFHMPSLHPGIFYLPPRPGWIIRPAPAASLRLFAASDSNALLELQQSTVDGQEARLLGSAMEINASPVVLTGAEFWGSYARIAGRYWLNGASGDRLRMKYDLANPGKARQERTTIAFRHAQFGASFQIPVWRQDSGDLDIAIQLRNGFNYFHFTAETLGSLAHFAQDQGGRPINLHLPEGELRGFVGRFIAAIFPELAPRVRLVHAPQPYAAVRSVYNHRHYLYQVRDDRVTQAAAQALDPRWTALRSETMYRKAVSMASFDSSLRLLRDHALRRVPAGLAATMPRLVWMGRDSSGQAARLRPLTGHEPLLEELCARGFEVVNFEHLGPLEQVAAMQGADIVIAPHGAGLANMAYARPDTTVIEIGHRQTQLYRWGDFLPLAHVSRCNYTTVFADIAGAGDPDAVPPISQGLLGVHVGRRATDRIIRLIDRDLERRRRKQTARASTG